MDPTEFGTYMNAILCKNCKGKVVPTAPLKSNQWRCEECTTQVPVKEIGNMFSLIGAVLKGFREGDFEFMHKFLTGKLSTLVPEYNETAVELKLRIIWLLGYQNSYLWKGKSSQYS